MELLTAKYVSMTIATAYFSQWLQQGNTKTANKETQVSKTPQILIQSGGI